MLNKIISFVVRLYSLVFARTFFYKLNKLLYLLSIHGIGLLNYKGENSSGEHKFIKKYLGKIKNPTVFDIGANIGKYSKMILDINKTAIIYAFEPSIEAYQKLTHNLNSKNLHLYNIAIGKEIGEVYLYNHEMEMDSVHASIFKEVFLDLHKTGAINKIKVSMTTLGNFIKENKIKKIDLIKIDTEGNEFDVLLGLADFLKNGKIKAIQFEFNEMNVISKVFFKDFWDLFTHNKYSIYRLLPDGIIKIKVYSPLFLEIFAYQNFVAIFEG